MCHDRVMTLPSAALQPHSPPLGTLCPPAACPLSSPALCLLLLQHLLLRQPQAGHRVALSFDLAQHSWAAGGTPRPPSVPPAASRSSPRVSLPWCSPLLLHRGSQGLLLLPLSSCLQLPSSASPAPRPAQLRIPGGMEMQGPCSAEVNVAGCDF